MKLKLFISLFILIGVWACQTKSSQTAEPEIHFRLDGAELDCPVGLIYQKGNYHLFYRYHNQDAKARWGQAMSNDLVHWENREFNLELDSDASMGMGSIVTDWNNTSGLGTENPPILAFYTIAQEDATQNPSSQTIQLAFSSDGGENWLQAEDYTIVLDHLYEQVQDTKVFWHEDSQRWLMLVLAGYEVRFYASANLVDWEYQSQFGDDVYLKDGEWTTIDFFPMEEENSKALKWVLLISSDAGSPNEGSGIQYFVGNFDGFVYQASHNKPKWIDHGSDCYAGVVLADYFPEGQDAFFISSVTNSIYTKFNLQTEKSGAFSLPRSFRLKEMYHDYYLISTPVSELNSLVSEEQLLEETELAGNTKILDKLPIPCEINLKFDVNNRLYLGMAEVFGLRLKNRSGRELILGYQSERRYFFIAEPAIAQQYPDTWDGFNYAPYVTSESSMDLKVIIDHHSIELYAMNGLMTLTRKFAFDGSWSVELFADGGNVKLTGGDVFQLQSAW